MNDSGIHQIPADQLTAETRLPVKVMLDGQTLQVNSWLRVLPGKRLVGQARFQGRDVLVKLFIDNRALAKAGLELTGVQRLLDAGLPTPTLIEHGQAANSNYAWVITEFITNAQHLAQLANIDVEHSVIDGPAPDCLKHASRVLAKLHNHRLIQSDIHPRNLLFDADKDKWLLIDAAEIMAVSGAKCIAKIRNNLALFLAQFPDHWRQTIIEAYRQEAEFTIDLEALSKEADQCKLWRARAFAEKSLRNATQFKTEQDFGHFFTSWRKLFTRLNLPSSRFDEMIANASMLKDGGSATLVRLDIEESPVVLKRYNMKNLWHWLRRVLRPSRAWHSWKVGHQLRVLGIRTPKPLAMLENRWGILRREAYLLTEFCEGKELQSFMKESSGEDLLPVITELRNLLTLMQHYRIAHGDFKARNFIWNGQLNLIDLDAVKFFSNERQWRRAYNKDLDRLLKNWPEGSAAHSAILELVRNFN